MLRKRKVGLALGGGGAWGLAHIGVLQVLQDEQIPIDMIAGTSAGAVIGAMYAQGKDASLIKGLAKLLDWKRLASLVDITLSKTSLIRGKKITNWLSTVFGGDIQFSELKIPFACVATDVHTCEEVVIRKGSVLEGIRASFSIPAVFAPVRLQERYLVDGGMVNPVPVSVLREMGAELIIAVSVTPDISDMTHKLASDGMKGLRAPGMFSVMVRMVQITSCALSRYCLEAADIVIKPRLMNIGFGDLHRGSVIIPQGEIAAREAIPEIRKRLKG